MPQASDELRAYWGGADDAPAIEHLKSRGYVLTRRWTWIKPEGLEPSKRDWCAIQFLAEEWDFGGLEEGGE